MDKKINPLSWLDDAFAKEIVDELEVACCLTDGQTEVHFSNKVTRADVEHHINPKVRTSYGIIKTWRLNGLPLFAFFDKALEQNLPHLRWFTLLNKCKEYLLNLTEEKQNEYIENYANIGRKLNFIANQRRHFTRVEYNYVPEDITRLTVKYLMEPTQKIIEEAEKEKFYVFGKVYWKDGTESFRSLTPPEVTAVRNNHPDRTNVIIGHFFCNLSELWVRSVDADKLLGLSEQGAKESEVEAKSKPKTTNEQESGNKDEQPELSDDDLDDMYNTNPKDRNGRLFERAIQLLLEMRKKNPKIKMTEIYDAIIKEEVGKSNVQKSTLKQAVKRKEVIKEMKKRQAEQKLQS